MVDGRHVLLLFTRGGLSREGSWQAFSCGVLLAGLVPVSSTTVESSRAYDDGFITSKTSEGIPLLFSAVAHIS